MALVSFVDEIPAAHRPAILKWIPENWDTLVTKYVADRTIILLTSVKTKDELSRWLEDFQTKSFCTYSTYQVRKCEGKYVVVKKVLYCHHNTRVKVITNRRKNTNCPSRIFIAIRRIVKNSRSKMKYQPTEQMPCVIVMNINHNHSITSSEVLRFRRVGNDTNQKLIQLFKQGHSPASALKSLKMNYALIFEDSSNLMNDRNRCPDYKYVYRLYKKEMCKSERTHEVDDPISDHSSRVQISHDQLRENLQSTAEDLVDTFSRMLMSHFHQSPSEIVNALRVVNRRILNMTSSDELVSALINFGMTKPDFITLQTSALKRVLR